jgi:hypothetical protein
MSDNEPIDPMKEYEKSLNSLKKMDKMRELLSGSKLAIRI